MTLNIDPCSRREFIAQGVKGSFGLLVSASILGRGMLAFADDKPATASTIATTAKSIVFVSLNGGPSHIDTFDPKPGAPTGGSFKAIESSIKGYRLSEHLPKLGKLMKHLNVVNSLSSPEGSHQRAQHLMQSGYVPAGPVRFPGFGAVLAHEHSVQDFPLPAYVALGGRMLGSGYLGARYSPFVIRRAGQKVANIDSPSDVNHGRMLKRRELLEAQERDFASGRNAKLLAGHRETYKRSHAFMSAEGRKAFDISSESEKMRKAYGESQFGQSCLTARRLVESGVPFVSVNLGGWDTHRENFPRVAELSRTLDSGLGQLVQDLVDRDLLKSTIILCAGEFGRTPRINPNAGRDHYPRAFSALIGGGGLASGQVIGKTDKNGATVIQDKVHPRDLYATIAGKLGLDRNKVFHSDVGRPFRIVHQDAKPVKGLL